MTDVARTSLVKLLKGDTIGNIFTHWLRQWRKILLCSAVALRAKCTQGVLEDSPGRDDAVPSWHNVDAEVAQRRCRRKDQSV